MEPDRYQQNSRAFVSGMMCLLISMTLLAFSLYLLPFLVLSCVYNVPDFIINYCQWLIDNYGYSQRGAGIIVFLSLFLPGLMAGWFSCTASNNIDDEIHHISDYAPEVALKKQRKSEVTLFSLKVLAVIIAVLVVLMLVQWLFFSIP